MTSVENAAVHGEVDACGEGLRGREGGGDVKDGVGLAEAGGLHGPSEDDRFVRDADQFGGRDGHGVCAVGDNDVGGGVGRDGVIDELAVFVGEFQAVFAHEG